MKETFGQRLARLRKAKGLTQEDIAEKIMISSQAVSKWENDLSAPDIQTLITLSEILSVSLDELMGKEVEKATTFLNPQEKKDFSKMTLKIKVLSKNNDKVSINIPMALVQVCLETGMELPQINGSKSLSSVDLTKILNLVEQGVIGELLTIDSDDGDHISIVVEWYENSNNSWCKH